MNSRVIARKVNLFLAQLPSQSRDYMNLLAILARSAMSQPTRDTSQFDHDMQAVTNLMVGKDWIPHKNIDNIT